MVTFLLIVLQLLCVVAGWYGIIYGLKNSDYATCILGTVCSLVGMVGLIVMAI